MVKRRPCARRVVCAERSCEVKAVEQKLPPTLGVCIALLGQCMHTVFLRKLLEVQRSRRDTHGGDHCWQLTTPGRIQKTMQRFQFKPFKKNTPLSFTQGVTTIMYCRAASIKKHMTGTLTHSKRLPFSLIRQYFVSFW